MKAYLGALRTSSLIINTVLVAVVVVSWVYTVIAGLNIAHRILRTIPGSV